jgi:hypothetical protein
MPGSAIGLSATDASFPRRCEFDEHALEPDASLFVGVDDLAGPRDRCCDVEGQVAILCSKANYESGSFSLMCFWPSSWFARNARVLVDRIWPREERFLGEVETKMK